VYIDNFTIMVGAVAATLMFGGGFFFFWLQDRQATWLAWWTGPFVLGAAGIALFVARGAIADWISIGLANALLFMAFSMVWQGARVFVDKRPNLPSVFLPAVLWMVLCAIPGYMELTTLRIVIATITIGVFSVLTALELRVGAAEKLPSHRAASFVLTSFSILLAIRIPLTGYLPFPMGDTPMASTFLGFVNLVVLGHVGAFAMLMVSLTKERREAEQRNFALLDPLTGLMNRRAFMGAAERMARRPTQQPMALLVLDLDKFKQVNDRFGHEVGDRVLTAFAQVAESRTRPSDQLFRLGGEEFCILLPDTELTQALSVAERIRESFALSRTDVRGLSVGTTVSIGLAMSESGRVHLDALLEFADAALYEAKARGRNQVVVAGPTALRGPMIDPRPISQRRLA
jgi:diguanylate cyclase (GGDEF)-like protein